MTIGTYLAGSGMEFFKSIPVIMIMILAEWLCFLFYVRLHVGAEIVRRPLPAAALLGLNAVLAFRFYPIALHCVLQMTLWTVFLCMTCPLHWHSALFDSSVFCLLLELGKSLFRGGTFAYVLWSRFPGLGQENVSRITFIVYLVYLVLLCVFFRFTAPKETQLDFNARQSAGLLFPLILYLFTRQFQSGLDPTMPVSLYFSLDMIGMAEAVCMLIVMGITTSMLRTQRSRNELLRRQLLAKQQHSQFLIQKEAIDAVNRKYHDLKHYLAALETGDSEQLRQIAGEMRREIQPVETICRTGSEALDVLVSQRIMECQEKEIRFVPYIDGRNLEWMSVVDLCTLFGNAMDNAVEASMEIADPARREISVKIEHYGSMVIFRFVNCVEGARIPAGETARGEERFRKGESMLQGVIFRTTKPDASSHGFGLSSIRSIAEKYGGSMTAACEDGVFELVVLFPEQ